MISKVFQLPVVAGNERAERPGIRKHITYFGVELYASLTTYSLVHKALVNDC